MLEQRQRNENFNNQVINDNQQQQQQQPQPTIRIVSKPQTTKGMLLDYLTLALIIVIFGILFKKFLAKCASQL